MNHQTILQMSRAPLGLRVSDISQRISMKTQLMAANFAANGVCFSLFPSNTIANATALVAFVQSLRLQFTCITAFATPVTVGRSLRIAEGLNRPATAGGTQLNKAFPKMSKFVGASIFDAINGGNVWISDTGPLTGPLPNSDAVIGEISLAGYGNAGATLDKTFVFEDPIAVSSFNANDTFASNTDLVIYSPNGMDAGGTWELVVDWDIAQLPITFPIST